MIEWWKWPIEIRAAGLSLAAALAVLGLCGCGLVTTPISNGMPKFEATPGCTTVISGEITGGFGVNGSARFDSKCVGAAPAPADVVPVPALAPM